MKRLLRIGTGILLSVLFSGALAGQDVHFSQIEYSPLTLNPALAGANHSMKGIVNYRSQWGSIAFPFTTFAASFDMRQNPLDNGKSNSNGFLAGGINFFHDEAGDVKLRTSHVTLNVAYHLFIDDNSTVGLGLQGGIGQRSIGNLDGIWGNQFNGYQFDTDIPSGEVFNNPSFIHADAGAGFLYTYRKLAENVFPSDQLIVNAGLSAFHVNRPYYSFLNRKDERLQVRWAAFVNGVIGFKNKNFSINPGIYYNIQGHARALLFGSYFRFLLKEPSRSTGFINGYAMALGVFYRNGDAVIPRFMFELGNYSLGASYDINISQLAGSTLGRGGMEFFFRVIIPSAFAPVGSPMF